MRVLNLGSLNIDKTYKVPYICPPKETIRSDGFMENCGGKGLNQSVALAKAGADTSHAGAVGRDGDMLLDMLRSAGVHTEPVLKLQDAVSGQAIIQVDRKGQNCIVLFTGTNEMLTREYIEETIGQFEAGDLLLLQNEVNEIGYAAACAKKQGMLVALNPSPVNERLDEVDYDQVDFFIMNEIEAQYVGGLQSDDMDTVVEGISRRFPNTACIITFGEKGSVYIKGEEQIRQSIYHVPVADTTGAGDTFTGYFLAGMAQGLSPKACMQRAAAASAISVGRSGAAQSIPAAAEVEAFMAEHPAE